MYIFCLIRNLNFIPTIVIQLEWQGNKNQPLLFFFLQVLIQWLIFTVTLSSCVTIY
jgi:hypothetical protein